MNLPTREELLAKRPALLAKIDACSSVQEAEPFIHKLDQLDEMIEQVSPRRVGLVDVKPSAGKAPEAEPIPPQPKPINYQRKGVDVCKACSSMGSASRPLIVFKKISANHNVIESGPAIIEEIYAHRECIGILMVVHSRSLFQVKLTLSGDRT